MVYANFPYIDKKATAWIYSILIFYLYVNQINFAKGLELEPMHCCHKKVSTHKYQELFWGKVKKEKYLDSTEIRHRYTSGKNLLIFERILH